MDIIKDNISRVELINNFDEEWSIRMKEGKIKLLEATKIGGMSLEEAIERWKSRRSFKKAKLTKEELSQLIWSGSAEKAPSAGATYPLTLYVVGNRRRMRR